MSSAMEIDGEEPKVEITDLRSPTVIDRYRGASNIAQTALNGAITKAVPGALISEVCKFTDTIINTLCAKQFKSAKMEKGVAFPTCLSVNECVGHFSPLDDVTTVLAVNDVVKIQLGVHVDGYVAMAAHTIIVADPTIPPVIPSTQADVMAAAYYCAEAAVRLIKPGNTNTMVTEAIAAISSAFGVTPVQGVLMHELKRHIIDSSKTILLRGDDPEIKVNEVTFELNQVWHIDVLLSTGEGKPREAETRTTIFKLVPENEYRPKMNAAQNTQREATKKFAFMPFTLRALENKSEARLGITELIKHGVVSPYPVLYERTGVQLAHFGFTVLLMPNGTLKLTGLPLLESIPNTTTKVLPDSIKALLQTVPYTKPVKATTQ